MPGGSLHSPPEGCVPTPAPFGEITPAAFTVQKQQSSRSAGTGRATPHLTRASAGGSGKRALACAPCLGPGLARTRHAAHKALVEAELRVSASKGHGNSLITAPKEMLTFFSWMWIMSRAQPPALPGTARQPCLQHCTPRSPGRTPGHQFRTNRNRKGKQGYALLQSRFPLVAATQHRASVPVPLLSHPESRGIRRLLERLCSTSPHFTWTSHSENTTNLLTLSSSSEQDFPETN